MLSVPHSTQPLLRMMIGDVDETAEDAVAAQWPVVELMMVVVDRYCGGESGPGGQRWPGTRRRVAPC